MKPLQIVIKFKTQFLKQEDNIEGKENDLLIEDLKQPRTWKTV